MSEWQRTVVENPEFVAAIQQLRQSLGLPVSGFVAFVRWLDNTDPEVRQQLRKAIEELIQKHNVRKEWAEAIWNRVIGGDDFPLGPRLSTGLPWVRGWHDGERFRDELVIDEDVDLENPIVQDYIKQLRDAIRSTPPMPQPSKDNPRKLDWIPVWEWSKRHPDVEVNELARMLGYRREYLSRKLSEVEAERSSHKSE
jgi:hypothetical protein